MAQPPRRAPAHNSSMLKASAYISDAIGHIEMLNLSFNQKVGLGFAIILVLLAISGGTSLWNLNEINRSNTRVHETAVPVVRVANQVQILLLKLANVSALGYNATTEEAIKPYRDDFTSGANNFSSVFAHLESLVEQDAAKAALVKDIKSNYQTYNAAVNAMFDAKTAQLEARKKADDIAAELIGLSDDVGNSYMDIVYYQAPAKNKKDMDVAAGHANQADAYLTTLAKTIEEISRTNDLARTESAVDEMNDALASTVRSLDMVDQYMSQFDEEHLVQKSRDFIDALQKKINESPGLANFKKDQLTEIETASQKLGEAKQAVGLSVTDLDNLLTSSDTTFSQLQKALADSLDLGFKATIGITIVLLLLATQNFISMRNAIRKKMIDLAKLNTIGSTLASARDQTTALNEVLQSLAEKIGIEQGSVYLFNKRDELKARAFLPPKAIESDKPAITFTLGEGIIGRAAESKKIIFVPNTRNDKNYISGEGEKERALLCVPLVDKDILIGVMNFSGDIKKVTFADSDYEFASSVALSLVTTIKNIRMVEVIEEHNRNLEKKVEERTAALKQKNDDIANMLSNMHQGLFTIIEGGLIHPEYASYLEKIFETPNIANRNFVDLLFRHTNLSEDVIDSAVTAVASIIGEDSMMYEFNSHLLVKELTITLKQKPDKLLELDWDPIMDENDAVSKLMVTVRDVTDLKALQAEAEGQKQELMMIGEILAVDSDKFNEFIDGSYDFVDKCRSIIEETEQKDKERIAELFRNIHTIKGNARTYGFRTITETVHKIENTYDQLRKDEEMEWQPEQLLAELDSGKDVISKYDTIFREKLARIGRSKGSQLDRSRVDALMHDITTLPKTPLDGQFIHVIREAYNLLASTEAKTLDVIIADVREAAISVAKEIGRAEPNIVINHGGIFIRNEADRVLNNIFMHLLRNAVDHGIEDAQERLMKGKPEEGSIWINAAIKDGHVSISVIDNGRGLALEKIWDRVRKRNQIPEDTPRPPAAELANHIFSSGFSTRGEISTVSGRGVGLDAVRQFLISVGGNIELLLDQGEETDHFRGFLMLITLPSQYYVAPPALLKKEA
ncbi:Putative signal transduction histidine kinase [gamma proteobacterium HdN1]|nr:Putative signal transduction histidine kinase [gamma proteobacterium HdN1]